MHVQVNGRYQVHRVTGMQRYAREIVARLENKLEVLRPGGEIRGARGHLWEQAVLPWRMRRNSVLWSPCQTGPLAVRKQVVTIHDTAFIDTAYCFTRSFAAWYQFLVPRLARRVPKIITVSEFSKECIADRCRVPAEKIAVIHSGVDPRFAPASAERIAAVRERLQLPPRYVLCVCSLEPRKNLLRLLQAWQQVASRLDGLTLVLAGAKGHVFRDIGLESPPPAVHLPGYIEDDDLPAVYSAADFFVFPSIYEGFGFPVVEAMACNTPVLCSDVTSLPEVAGGAALLVDPWQVESIAQGIQTLAGDAALRDELRQKGLVNARRFCWSQATQATWDVLAEAA